MYPYNVKYNSLNQSEYINQDCTDRLFDKCDEKCNDNIYLAEPNIKKNYEKSLSYEDKKVPLRKINYSDCDYKNYNIPNYNNINFYNKFKDNTDDKEKYGKKSFNIRPLPSSFFASEDDDLCLDKNLNGNLKLDYDYSKKIVNDKIVNLLLEGIQLKKMIVEYYNNFVDCIDDFNHKNILNSIRLDEQKHEKLLKKIYMDLCDDKSFDFNKENTNNDYKKIFTIDNENGLINEFKNAFEQELNCVDLFKNLYNILNNEYENIKKIIHEVFTDDIAHSIKLNYLVTLNS